MVAGPVAASRSRAEALGVPKTHFEEFPADSVTPLQFGPPPSPGSGSRSALFYFGRHLASDRSRPIIGAERRNFTKFYRQ